MARVRSPCHGPEHQATPSHPPLRSVKRRAHFLLGPRCSSPALSSLQTSSCRIYRCVAAPSAAERSLEDPESSFRWAFPSSVPVGLARSPRRAPPSPIVLPLTCPRSRLLQRAAPPRSREAPALSVQCGQRAAGTRPARVYLPPPKKPSETLPARRRGLAKFYFERPLVSTSDGMQPAAQAPSPR